MERFHETLIDIALEIGYQMGENGETFAIDSREAVSLIAQKAADFEKQHAQAQGDYLSSVQEAAKAVYWELRLQKAVEAQVV